ncbi:hypothetical protein FHS86_003040 [Roseimarinus sediminis]
MRESELAPPDTAINKNPNRKRWKAIEDSCVSAVLIRLIATGILIHQELKKKTTIETIGHNRIGLKAMGSNWKRWKAIVITFARNGNLCNGVLMNLCTQVLRNSKKDTIEKG